MAVFEAVVVALEATAHGPEAAVTGRRWGRRRRAGQRGGEATADPTAGEAVVGLEIGRGSKQRIGGSARCRGRRWWLACGVGQQSGGRWHGSEQREKMGN